MWRSFSKWNGERAKRKTDRAIERQNQVDQLADEKQELERRGFEKRKDGFFWRGFLGVAGHPKGRVSGFRFWGTDFKQILALLDDIEGRRYTPVVVGKDKTGSYYLFEAYQSLRTGSTDDTCDDMRRWVDRKRAAHLNFVEFDPWTGKEIKEENTPE